MMVMAQYRRRQRQEGLWQKESLEKVWEKYDRSNEHSKNNDYGKGSEKGKERGKKGKGKRTRKRRETSAKLEFPRLLQVMWQMVTQGE